MNTPERGATMREIRRVHAENGLPRAARKFMAPTKPVEELYDLQRYPHEVTNIAGSPMCKVALERLRAAHLAWVLHTRDLGLIPEPEIARREKRYGNRYEILRQPGADDLLRRIRDTASLTLESEAAQPKLVEALGDTDAVVRYWGAIGLGNLGAAAASSSDRLQSLLKDESPSVRIASARALCRMKKPEAALPVLARELRGGTQWVRLNAAIVLDEIDEDARPVVAAMKAALTPRKELFSQGKYTVRVINRALNELLGTDNRVR
jgi:uncharacterized sulfatase